MPDLTDQQKARLLNAIERDWCPTCGQNPARYPEQRRWDEDPIRDLLALPLGIRCPDCGGQIEGELSESK